MTCVAAFEYDDVIAIASDSMMSWGDTYLNTVEKIVKVGKSLVGISGQAQSINFFRVYVNQLTPEEKSVLGCPGSDDVAMFVNQFVEWMVHTVQYNPEYDSAKNSNTGFVGLEGNMIFATPNGIFVVGVAGCVVRAPNYWAIGSGGSVAIGYMQCLRELWDSSRPVSYSNDSSLSERGVRAALVANCKVVKSVKEPIFVYSVKREE